MIGKGVKPGHCRARRFGLWLAGLATLLALFSLWLWRSLAFDAPEEFLLQKGRLEAVDLEAAGSDSAYEAYGVVLHSDAGYSVRGHLRVPRADGRWPSLIVIGGINTGRMAAELFTPEEPYVILGLDYPWEGPTRLNAWQFLLRLLKIRSAMFLTPSAVMLAMDYLEAHPRVAPQPIVLVGASFGAQLITVTGALDERARAVLVIYGGGDYRALLNANLKVKPAWLRSALAGAGGWLLDPIEPLHYVSAIAPRPVILINGLQDDRIPRRSVEAMYEAAGEPKELVWLDEGHISSRDTALLGRVLQASAAALDRLDRASTRASREAVRSRVRDMPAEVNPLGARSPNRRESR